MHPTRSVCVCMYVYIYIYTCIHFVCVYIYTERERERGRAIFVCVRVCIVCIYIYVCVRVFQYGDIRKLMYRCEFFRCPCFAGPAPSPCTDPANGRAGRPSFAASCRWLVEGPGHCRGLNHYLLFWSQSPNNILAIIVSSYSPNLPRHDVSNDAI